MVEIKNSSSGDHFEILIKINESIKNGKILLINKNSKYKEFYDSVIEQKQYELLRTTYKDNIPAIDPDNTLINKADSSDVFLDDIKIPDITYDKDLEDRLSTIKGGVSGSIKSATFLSMLLSFSSAVALVKIFQMFDFFIYFSVDLPNNYKRMLEIFSSNLLNDFPNIFRFLVDDDCGEIRPKFAENDLSCQFISNCGQLIFIAILLCAIKFGFFILKNAMSTREGTVDTKWGVRVGRIYESMGKEFFVTIMDMFQLDLYLGIYLQMDDFQIRSKKSLVNITVGMITFALLSFTKIYLFFISTRVAIVRDERHSANKGYRKEYVEYEFMNEEMKCDSWFSKHYLILNLIKDAFVAMVLVFFSTNGFFQVGLVLVVMAVFLGYQLFTSPFISAESQVTAVIGFVSYTGIMVFFMALVMTGKNMSTNIKEYLVGLPLIILTSALIVRVFFVNIRNSYR